MDFYVKVEPDSGEFKIEEGSFLKVYLTKPAENNKANAELVGKLESILGQKLAVISGHRSRRKKLKVDLPERKFKEKIDNSGY
jgi:uncharacterized protein (TIGR00251 family)